MEIQINECPVDFNLNGEKSVSDVINSIVEWTSRRNLIFTEAEINNSNYLLDSLPDIPLDEIKTINCLVSSKADLVISSIEAGIAYCEKINKFIEKSIAADSIETGETGNIAAGIEWIIEVLGKTADLLGVDIDTIKYKDSFPDAYVDRILEFKEIVKTNKSNDILNFIRGEKDLFISISAIFRMLSMHENMRSLIIQSIDSPDVLLKSLLGIKKELPVQIENLEEIAVAYQTGKDNAAFEKLQLFINFIFNYSRTCSQIAPVFEINPENIIVDDISLSGKNASIQDLLNDIIRSLEKNDIISLSDILEYEMKSSLEKLEVYIDSLIELLKRNT